VRILLLLIALLSGPALSQGVDSNHAQNNFMLHCQGCHKADGSGLPGSVPSMKNFVSKFLSVPEGREFLIRVPGSANSSLSDKDLAELLNWMLMELSTEGLPDDFTLYTEVEVRQERARVLVDVAAFRATLVAQMKLP